MYLDNDIEYETFDGTKVQSLLTGDPDSGRAIIVIQEIWGLSNFIRSYSRRLSSLDFLVLAPHLYSRTDEKELFKQENISNAMKLFFEVPPDKRRDAATIQKILERASSEEREVIKRIMLDRGTLEKRMIKDLERGYEFLVKTYKPKKMGVVGFCMGGGLSFQISTKLPFDATVIFYGANPPEIGDIANIKGPVMALYAGDDPNINSGIPDAVSAFVKYGKQIELKIYPGARHAFFNNDGLSYNKEAADDAWERSSSFFRRYVQ